MVSLSLHRFHRPFWIECRVASIPFSDTVALLSLPAAVFQQFTLIFRTGEMRF